MIREAEQYLEMRRKLGYVLTVQGRQLLRFARYVTKRGIGDLSRWRSP